MESNRKRPYTAPQSFVCRNSCEARTEMDCGLFLSSTFWPFYGWTCAHSPGLIIASRELSSLTILEQHLVCQEYYLCRPGLIQATLPKKTTIRGTLDTKKSTSCFF